MRFTERQPTLSAEVLSLRAFMAIRAQDDWREDRSTADAAEGISVGILVLVRAHRHDGRPPFLRRTPTVVLEAYVAASQPDLQSQGLRQLLDGTNAPIALIRSTSWA
ncbi:MAG TPA: hypothetical protein PKK30_11145, partial [Nitrospira sp.]|nr:hypothetical protein [Nitrospira sp.]